MTMAPIAACFWDGDWWDFSSPTDLSMTRKRAIYSIEKNWRVIPAERARLRPIQSIRKKAQIRAEINFTRPKMAVAKSFSR